MIAALLSLTWSLGALGLAVAGLVYMFSPNHARELLKKVGIGVGLATIALMLLAALITQLRAGNSLVIGSLAVVSVVAYIVWWARQRTVVHDPAGSPAANSNRGDAVLSLLGLPVRVVVGAAGRVARWMVRAVGSLGKWSHGGSSGEVREIEQKIGAIARLEESRIRLKDQSPESVHQAIDRAIDKKIDRLKEEL